MERSFDLRCRLLIPKESRNVFSLYGFTWYNTEKNYLDVYRFESWGGSMIPTYVFGQQVCF
ncbi:hypothetical protein CK203_036079 [Vitis vinifera]|uniref:Uncharacterized protein n=1 Tax=Vitis vinifera TaxID=29760 RepID=A0A438HR09_VITVI|nr:hypothetical protein CK203_036079 [Vitis vinifera]